MEAELIGSARGTEDVISGGNMKDVTIGDTEDCKNDTGLKDSEAVADGALIAPITPIPVREVRDVRSSTLVKCHLPKDGDGAEVLKETECGSLRTPKQSVFDSIASGPEEMCLTPTIKKKTVESGIKAARQLVFGSLDSEKGSEVQDNAGKTDSHGEMLLESVYGNILDVIVSNQAEDIVTEHSAQDADSCGFKTPPCVPYLNAVGKKCPDAPVKPLRPMRKRLNVDPSLCRRLF